MLKVTGPRDRLTGRGWGRRKQKGTDAQMVYCRSMAKKEPKGDCGPTTEQDETRLTDRGGQELLLESHVYHRTPWGGHDEGQTDGSKPSGYPTPGLKGT